jgi:hypothetical protein
LPTYSAVSYEWGSIVREHEIFCNDRVLKVTANLSLLLSKFRTSDASQVLWIDAICINQDDLDERSQQVLLMGKIYKNAAVVLMWIGDQTTYTADAVPVIRWFADLLHVLKLDPRKNERSLLGPYAFGQNLDSSAQERIVAMQENLSWSTMIDLLSRTYFSRLWIIQEIVLSSKAVAVCGELRIEWKTFYEAALCIKILGIDLGTAPFDHVITYLGELCFRPLRHTMTLILIAFSDAKVTDPRDHVYGYLGILDDRSVKHKIRADYSSTVEEVFRMATEDIIVQQDLGLFEMQSIEPNSRPRAAMPSWARDWGFDRSLFYPRDVPEIGERLGGVQTVTAEGSSLIIWGQIIDSIVVISDNFSEENFKQILLEAFMSDISALTEKTAENASTATRKMLQCLSNYQDVLSLPLGEQSLYALLASWVLEDLGLTSAVLSQNPKIGKLAVTNPSLRRWISDGNDDETDIRDLVRNSTILQWLIKLHEQDISGEASVDWENELSNSLYEAEHPLGVNMFRSTKGFRGVGPGGYNLQGDDPAVRVGDYIALFPTVKVPMILRKHHLEEDAYVLIGTAHVGNITAIPWYEGETPSLGPIRIR